MTSQGKKDSTSKAKTNVKKENYCLVPPKNKKKKKRKRKEESQKKKILPFKKKILCNLNISRFTVSCFCLEKKKKNKK